MVFNGVFLFVLGIVCLIWVSVLTVLLAATRGHYNRLAQGISKRGLADILEEILKREKRLSDRTDALEQAAAALAKDGAFHITKVGLIRFNPFSDTGGTQSFTVALLDANNSGLVMTSLYGRTGNRWYVKEVDRAKGRGIELSKEEVSAIDRAQMLKKQKV